MQEVSAEKLQNLGADFIKEAIDIGAIKEADMTLGVTYGPDGKITGPGASKSSAAEQAAIFQALTNCIVLNQDSGAWFRKGVNVTIRAVGIGVGTSAELFQDHLGKYFSDKKFSERTWGEFVQQLPDDMKAMANTLGNDFSTVSKKIKYEIPAYELARHGAEMHLLISDPEHAPYGQAFVSAGDKEMLSKIMVGGKSSWDRILEHVKDIRTRDGRGSEKDVRGQGEWLTNMTYAELALALSQNTRELGTAMTGTRQVGTQTQKSQQLYFAELHNRGATLPAVSGTGVAAVDIPAHILNDPTFVSLKGYGAKSGPAKRPDDPALLASMERDTTVGANV